MLIIGDVHCKIKKYFELIQSEKESIQVGDFGFKNEHDWHLNNISPLHKVNFGNHDYYPYLNKPHSCGNFSTVGDIFTVRGAHSIDQYKRISGRDWFENEELNYSETNDCVDLYETTKPKIVVAHDCPMFIATEFFNLPRLNEFVSHTRLLLESLVQSHAPEIFIFGHHHKSIDVTVNGTRYICLKELETFNL